MILEKHKFISWNQEISYWSYNADADGVDDVNIF